MVFKRGNTYWYKFCWTVRHSDGTREAFLVRRTARTRNQRRAVEMEEEHRRALRLGQVHPTDPWPPVRTPEAPTLAAFTRRLLDHARLHVKASSLRNYAISCRRIADSAELGGATLSKVNGEMLARYTRQRTQLGASVSTINHDIRTLRRMLHLAYEWEIIGKVPVIHELPGAKPRERVISFDEERRYLAAAGRVLHILAILAADTGLRLDSELFTLEWENVKLESTPFAPHGVLLIKKGKTENAVRVLPLTPRAQTCLRQQKDLALHRCWVFPGPGNSGHLVTIQQSHRKTLRKSGIVHFPFYSWRHTFGTRAAESGMDRFTLAKLMGHSSPRVSERYYIHVTESHVSLGFEKFLAYQSARLEQHLPNQDVGIEASSSPADVALQTADSAS